MLSMVLMKLKIQSQSGPSITKNRNFWSEFDSDEDFIYLVSGKYAEDEIDLDGGRDYFLIRSKVIPLLFRYMVENLGWSKEDYEEIIHNSLEISDNLIWMYVSSDKESKNERVQWRSFSTHLKDDDQFPKLEPIVLKYPESMRLTVNINKDLKFIGNSRIDGSPMYMIMVPSGYSVVNNIDTYTNRQLNKSLRNEE